MSGGAALAMGEARCVGDRAPHNAFCDLIDWHGALWLVWREGAAHVSPDGAVRLCRSADGGEWREAAHFAVAGEDLRDPKLAAMPDGRLMLLAAAVVRDAENRLLRLRNLLWLSADGRDWDGPHEVAERGIWLWRVTWHGGVAYGIGYSCNATAPGEDRYVRLYRSGDGLRYETHVARLVEGGYPNEHALAFTADGGMICLLRCDDERRSALLGRAAPPWLDWDWRPLGRRVGGPQMLALADGRILVGGRLYDGCVRTALCALDPEAATLEEIATLPSSGDSSYPGMVWKDGGLWFAWYSAHEGSCKVYVTRFTEELHP